MDKTLHNFQVKLRQEILDLADGNNRFPKAKPFEHGTQIGEWRGLNRALELLLQVINEEVEEEARQ